MKVIPTTEDEPEPSSSSSSSDIEPDDVPIPQAIPIEEDEDDAEERALQLANKTALKLRATMIQVSGKGYSLKFEAQYLETAHARMKRPQRHSIVRSGQRQESIV